MCVCVSVSPCVFSVCAGFHALLRVQVVGVSEETTTGVHRLYQVRISFTHTHTDTERDTYSRKHTRTHTHTHTHIRAHIHADGQERPPAVPWHQRQRLGHQIEVRQHLWLPTLFA